MNARDGEPRSPPSASFPDPPTERSEATGYSQRPRSQQLHAGRIQPGCMRLTLVRSATRDRSSSGAGGSSSIRCWTTSARGRRSRNTANPGCGTRPSRCRFPAEEVVRGLDAVLVTHRHRDHLDARAEELLPRDVPVFCQPEDEEALRELGLDARAVDGRARLGRAPRSSGRPRSTASARSPRRLGPVSGFVLDDLYLAGDTVWYDARRGDDRAPPAARRRSSTRPAPASSRAG